MAYNPPIGRKHTTYIPLIYCLLGDYIVPTTFYGNQKQPETTIDVSFNVFVLLFLVATPYSLQTENATEAVAADVASVEGRQKVQQRVAELCQGELGVGILRCARKLATG